MPALPTPGPAPGLYPTRTRLRLLQDCQAGQVYQPVLHPTRSRIVNGPDVTARIEEMRRADWVHKVAATRDVGIRLNQWMPTAVGERILAAMNQAATNPDAAAGREAIVAAAQGGPNPGGKPA